MGNNLTVWDRKILETENWLNDQLINAAPKLLKKQHGVSGLQDTRLQQINAFKVQGSCEFVQCLNLSSSHWIPVSTVGCPPAIIKVFDSLNLSLSSSLIRTIGSLIHTDKRYFTIEYTDMYEQAGSNDCGLFAICNDQDPSALKFKQSNMRSHLLSALEKKKLVPFDYEKRRVQPTMKKAKKVKVKVLYLPSTR